MTQALTHPEVFSIAGAHSPSLRGADGSLAFFGDREYFKQYDPMWLIENTNSWKRLTFWIDIGRDDAQWGGVIVQFHQWLDKLGVPHTYGRGQCTAPVGRIGTRLAVLVPDDPDVHWRTRLTMINDVWVVSGL